MKKFLLILPALLILKSSLAQVIYSNSFGSLNLQTYGSGSATVLYTTAPSGFSLINDGHNNSIGTTANPNAPFNVPALKTTGWATVYNANVKDTFLVSTSWLDSTLASSRWIITPTITNITANTVLTWFAMCPDTNYRDGYEVYGTNKTGTLTEADFTIGDKLFSLSDGSAGGGEPASWNRRSIPLGSFAGQTLRFAFRNNSSNMYQLWIDDIEVKTISKSLDGQVNAIGVKKYNLINTNDTVRVYYTNLGATNINTITLNYKYGNSLTQTQTFTLSQSLAYGQSTKLQFSLPFAFSSAGCYPVKCWASLANNVQDQDLTNDTTLMYVTAVASSPVKNVLMEQFVSANDGETPDAQEKLMALQNNQIIVVNIHDSDSIKEVNSASLISTYKKKTSTAMIDRVYYSDISGNTLERTYYASRSASRAAAVTPASVSIINKSYNSGTKQLSFTVKADFIGEVLGDYRIAAYLVENSVTGKTSDTTINGYNQLSNFYNIPWSPYYQKGYYSNTAGTWVLYNWQFKNNRTLIHSFDNGFGVSGVIPQTGGTQGQSYQVTYTLTLPTPTNGAFMYNADNVYIVGFISEYSSNIYQRNVLNCAQDKLTANNEIVGVKENVSSAKGSFYPNPANETVYLKVPSGTKKCEITLFDLLGKRVYGKIIENPEAIETIDIKGFRAGAYILDVKTDNAEMRKKIIIQNN